MKKGLIILFYWFLHFNFLYISNTINTIEAIKNKYIKLITGIELVFKNFDKSGTSITITCKRTEIITTKNTMLKISIACGTSAVKGNVANTIGAAPRKPTHDIINFSLIDRLKGIVVKNTAIGLAINVKINATKNACLVNAKPDLKLTSKPKIKNITICIIQATAS